ncbi:WD40 repeat-like protein [Suillus hirtellus]|nr:WD40 repeat-like protein [Suillus hirtellus]
MSHPAPAKHENSGTMLYRKVKVEHNGDIVDDIQYLPDGQRIITHSLGGSLRVWDLETGIQVKEWEDKFHSIALSPNGKTLASMSWDGAVTLWSIDTGNISRTLTELEPYTEIICVCWSPDGGQVRGQSENGTFRMWDARSGETIVGPIETGGFLRTVCYSPDRKMIATAGDWLKIWDGNTGKLLKTLIFEGDLRCLQLAWSSNGKTLTAWTLVVTGFQMMKFNTVTWTVLDVRETVVDSFIHRIFISPDGCFFATLSCATRKVQLWNVETNQPIGTPLHHEHRVCSGSFSADGKSLFTSCQDGQIYLWDLSAIVKEAGLADTVDATPRPAPKMKGAPRIPPGFFDDALREANSRIRLSQSHGPHDHPTPVPRQRIFSRFPSFWHRSKSHGETEHHTQPLSHSLSWTRNLVSGMLRRRDGSDIELREVEVPCTAGKPRNYHARKKPTASSSRPPGIHTTQKPNASSSKLPPTTTASTLFTVTSTAGSSGIPSRPHITIAGWRARFVGWICCMPIQNADGHH